MPLILTVKYKVLNILFVFYFIGLKAFIQNMLIKNDVYFVTMSQAIAWMKDPTPLDKIKTFKPWSC